MRYRDAAETRELLGAYQSALATARSAVAMVPAAILEETLLRGHADRCCLRLLELAPQDGALCPADEELYAAAISLGSALWHLQAGEDASAALSAAGQHLRAASGDAFRGDAR